MLFKNAIQMNKCVFRGKVGKILQKSLTGGEVANDSPPPYQTTIVKKQ